MEVVGSHWKRNKYCSGLGRILKGFSPLIQGILWERTFFPNFFFPYGTQGKSHNAILISVSRCRCKEGQRGGGKGAEGYVPQGSAQQLEDAVAPSHQNLQDITL